MLWFLSCDKCTYCKSLWKCLLIAINVNAMTSQTVMRWAVLLRVHEYVIMYRPAKDNGYSDRVGLS